MDGLFRRSLISNVGFSSRSLKPEHDAPRRKDTEHNVSATSTLQKNISGEEQLCPLPVCDTAREAFKILINAKENKQLECLGFANPLLEEGFTPHAGSYGGPRKLEITTDEFTTSRMVFLEQQKESFQSSWSRSVASTTVEVNRTVVIVLVEVEMFMGCVNMNGYTTLLHVVLKTAE